MIRCLIVDDEPIAIRVLETHLGKIPEVEVAATSTSAVEALAIVQREGIDLVFLDIEMPELSGVGFVEALAHPPRFIFTTAHRDYAVRGFELDAVDYLLKPIGLPRLLRAIEKFRRLEAPGASDGGDHAPAPINLQVDRRTVRIDPREIRYVESLGDYVVVHTDADRYTTKMRLRDVADMLAPEGFARIHRSYVVALGRVDSFTADEVQIGATTLPVSRSYRRSVMDLLQSRTATGRSR